MASQNKGVERLIQSTSDIQEEPRQVKILATNGIDNDTAFVIDSKDNYKRQGPTYYQEHRLALMQYARLYYQKNRDMILQKKKEYNERNRHRIVEARRRYYQSHKKEISRQQRQYRNNKKRQIDEALNVII